MVVQPPQTRVCLSCQSPEESSRTAQLEVEIAQLNEALRQRQQIRLATGLLSHRFAITPERGWTAAECKADENSGAANSKLGTVKDHLWPVIKGLTC
jgi:hypothetical protein